MTRTNEITVLGAFVSDATFRAKRMPELGETFIGDGFELGPGGKGSNQAVASARLGGKVSFITRLGDDAFGAMAYSLWEREGIKPLVVTDTKKETGAAGIFVDAKRGTNAIIIVPGAAQNIMESDVIQFKSFIEAGKIFISQLETPLHPTIKALEISRSAGVSTILNPAPAKKLEKKIMRLIDYFIPNEIEAEVITGIKIQSLNDAEVASSKLLEMGCCNSIITLGEKGAMLNNGREIHHIQAPTINKIIDTTGAGDCFCGSFAFALSQKRELKDSVQFACQTAAISTTRSGAANSMPSMKEVKEFIF